MNDCGWLFELAAAAAGKGGNELSVGVDGALDDVGSVTGTVGVEALLLLLDDVIAGTVRAALLMLAKENLIFFSKYSKR